MFSAIALPLFFFAAWRSVGGRESVKPGLKMAAVYAGLAMSASVAYGIYSGVSNEIFMWTHQAMLAAASGRTHVAGLWYRILIKSSGLFYSGSLAWFFFLFYKTVPTAQSKQRLSSGE